MDLLDLFTDETINGTCQEFTVAWRDNRVDVYPGNKYSILHFNKDAYNYKAIRVYRFGDEDGKVRKPNNEQLKYIYDHLYDVIFYCCELDDCVYGSVLF